MFASFRARGVAAAVAILSATVVGVGPSQAWELQAAPVSIIPHQISVAPESPQIVVPVQIDAYGAFAETPAVPEAALDATATLPPVVVAPAPIAPEPVLPAKRATLAQLVATHRSSSIPDRERECLAGAIYFESKGEPLSGQVAVGQVIANRANSGRFPKSWCGVVFQRSQFSFVRGGNLPAIPRSSAHWKTAVAVAHIVANDLTDAVVPKALFFHARYVSPNWKRLSRVATVGNHVFYR